MLVFQHTLELRFNSLRDDCSLEAENSSHFGTNNDLDYGKLINRHGELHNYRP